MEQPQGPWGWVEAQREVSSVLSVPCPLLNTGRNWHRGPQTQFCANNLILCQERGPPSYSTTTSRTLRRIPGGEGPGASQPFLQAPLQLPLSSPGSVVSALSAPSPWASQSYRCSDPNPQLQETQGPAPGCWQQAEDTKLLTCTFCPGLCPLPPSGI